MTPMEFYNIYWLGALPFVTFIVVFIVGVLHLIREEKK